MQNIEMGTGEPSQSRLTPCQIPPFVAARHLFLSLSPAVTFLPGAGRICPGRGKSFLSGGAGCDHREQTERVVAVGDWGSSPPATQKTSAGADVFVWCIIFYNFPHCLPVKKRRVVVARNTLPARNTVVGNSGWEGLQG